MVDRVKYRDGSGGGGIFKASKIIGIANFALSCLLVRRFFCRTFGNGDAHFQVADAMNRLSSIRGKSVFRYERRKERPWYQR